MTFVDDRNEPWVGAEIAFLHRELRVRRGHARAVRDQHAGPSADAVVSVFVVQNLLEPQKGQQFRIESARLIVTTSGYLYVRNAVDFHERPPLRQLNASPVDLQRLQPDVFVHEY